MKLCILTKTVQLIIRTKVTNIVKIVFCIHAPDGFMPSFVQNRIGESAQ